MKFLFSFVMLLMFAVPQSQDGMVAPKVVRKVHYDTELTCPSGYKTMYLMDPINPNSHQITYWTLASSASADFAKYYQICVAPKFLDEVRKANAQAN